jgi:peptidoglycan/LPS O-acetylase OafA/YrhL
MPESLQDERRYFGLDALRGGMMMLGIVLHAAFLYLAAPAPTMPIQADRNTSLVFDVLFALIHSFRMPTFFVLAGFFAALLVEKRGLWGTLRNRAARVLAPLVAGLFTLLPLTLFLFIDFALSARYGTHDLIPNVYDLQAFEQAMHAKAVAGGVAAGEQIPLAHLWFLYYLCYFYLLIPVCRALVAGSLAFEPRIKRCLESPLMLVAFALYTSLTLWPFHGGQLHEGFMFLKPHLPSLAYYGSFFVFGYAFHTYRGFLQALARDVKGYAVLAVFLFPLAQYASHLDNVVHGTDVARHLAAVLVNALCTWALVYMFIGGALRWFDRNAPWIFYLSQASYWVFLVHMPLVLFAGWLLTPYDVPAIVKFTLVCAFSAAVGLLTFHFWVQRTWVSRFLHGRRFNLTWPWRKPAVSQA